MKEFNLETAKKGAPVKTRDGRNVRIVCFDYKDPVKPIVALVEKTVVYELPERHEKIEEDIVKYSPQGKAGDMHNDLVIATEKREGWVNVVRYDYDIEHAQMDEVIHGTKKEAELHHGINELIATVKIEWEE